MEGDRTTHENERLCERLKYAVFLESWSEKNSSYFQLHGENVYLGHKEYRGNLGGVHILMLGH